MFARRAAAEAAGNFNGLYAVAAKRLEEGRFSWPAPSRGGQAKLKLAPEALQWLLDGVDLRGARLLPWYERQ
jgi:transposase